MFIVLPLLVILLFLVTGSLAIDRLAYDKILSSKETEQILEKIEPRYVNEIDGDILSCTHSFIALIGVPRLIGKYYISGYGIVPRWSKYNKVIENFYKTLPKDFIEYRKLQKEKENNVQD